VSSASEPSAWQRRFGERKQEQAALLPKPHG